MESGPYNLGVTKRTFKNDKRENWAKLVVVRRENGPLCIALIEQEISASVMILQIDLLSIARERLEEASATLDKLRLSLFNQLRA